MTCRDFMRYLIYVEHAAENLQFYLWFIDYAARFQVLTTSSKALSPEISSFANPSAEANNNGNGNNPKANKVASKFFADAFSISNARLATPAPTKENPFGTPPQTPGSLKAPYYNFENRSEGVIAPFMSGADKRGLGDVDHVAVAADAFQAVDMKWQPCELSISLVL